MKVWRMYIIDNRDETRRVALMIRNLNLEFVLKNQYSESVGVLTAHLIRGMIICLLQIIYTIKVKAILQP